MPVSRNRNKGREMRKAQRRPSNLRFSTRRKWFDTITPNPVRDLRKQGFPGKRFKDQERVPFRYYTPEQWARK